MIRDEKNGVPHYLFPVLDSPGAVHAVFTRRGGVSSGPYESLNLGMKVGDDPELVVENRTRICDVLAAPRLAVVAQVHGDRVLVLEKHGENAPRLWLTGEKADAMVTNAPGLFLAIKTADCQAVLLHDPVKKVVAAVHSGWRGSIANVAGKTVAAMMERFGSEPADIAAGIGPSLCPACSEFVNYRSEIPEPLWVYRDRTNRFDFWSMTRDQLLAAGLSGRRIGTAGLCTRCGPPEFFSYRRDKVTGRCASAIGLAS